MLEYIAQGLICGLNLDELLIEDAPHSCVEEHARCVDRLTVLAITNVLNAVFVRQDAPPIRTGDRPAQPEYPILPGSGTNQTGLADGFRGYAPLRQAVAPQVANGVHHDHAQSSVGQEKSGGIASSASA